MKTTKRYPATMSVYATIRHLHDDRARWKRKNRVKQLKRTIERLRLENFQMKLELHIPVNISYDEYHSRRVDFTEKRPEPYFDLT